ncbi:hypothetical protein H0H81_011973 [Sphagnurus paluster]|uniref:Uncharacterized protein n=1 Tax=Sphagnurus paluster TaxID=117069 RepID=A0A9P7GP29_9AGAR|nr:hypothetical protein H0H81_011973 [Sphagnurus paluster]
MPPVSRSSSAKNLKQATLPFGSVKRTSTAQSLKPKGSQTKKYPKLWQNNSHESSAEDLDLDEIHVVPSEEAQVVDQMSPNELNERPRTPPKSSIKKKRSQVKQEIAPSAIRQSKNKTRTQNPISQTLPDLNVNDPRWRKLYAAAREKMGYMNPSECI